MKIIFYDRFTVFTPDSSSIVLKRLNDHVEPPKTFRVEGNIAPYQGRVSETGFKISRIIDYQNSFLPVIQGKIEALETGTNVHIEMRFPRAGLIFLIGWCTLFLIGFIQLVVVNSEPLIHGLLLLIMPLGAIMIFSVTFWWEVNKSRQDLTRIIQG